MNKQHVRTLASSTKFIVCAGMAAMMAAATALADTENVNGITWTYSVSGGVALLGGGTSSSPAIPTSTSGAVELPSELGGVPVTVIRPYAFSGCSAVTEFTIPNSVTNIGQYAFQNCSLAREIMFFWNEEAIFIEGNVFPSGATVVMMSKEGYVFHGWVNDDGEAVNPTQIRDDPILLRAAFDTTIVLKNVSFRQRYPWNGLVDIDFYVKCGAPTNIIIAVSAEDKVTGKNLLVRNVWLENDATHTNALVVQNGEHRLIWDAGKDNPNFVSKSVAVTVKASLGESPLYMVIDLSGGKDAESYAVSYLNDVPKEGWTDEYKSTKLVLRKIPAGTFVMGSPQNELGRYDDEVQHEVTISTPFYIGVFEVSQKQCALVTGYIYSNQNILWADMRPVDLMSWNDIRGNSVSFDWPNTSEVDASSFMGKLRAKTGINSFDLPTEAMWEYACRAGTTTALNNGKDLMNEEQDSAMDEVGRYDYNRNDGKGVPNGEQIFAWEYHTTIGSYLPNNWGLYDMHGNVWEWCLDWADDYAMESVTNPVGSTVGFCRVIRGGGWSCTAELCRSAVRWWNSPDYWDEVDQIGMGFRLCCSSGPDIESVGGVSSESMIDQVDFRTGTRLVSGIEQITYSPRWGNATNCLISVTTSGLGVNDEDRQYTLVSATSEGKCEWASSDVGGHIFAHTAGDLTYIAQFTLPGEGTATHCEMLSTNEIWSASKVHLVTSMVTVPSGVTLLIEPGSVVKFMPGTALMVEPGGCCSAKGVSFTHVNDDTVQGDTLLDGDTAPVQDDYKIAGNVIDDDMTEYRYMAPQELPSSITSSICLRGHRVYVVSTDMTVASGATLTIQPGAILKFASGKSMIVNKGGTFDSRGTRAFPVIFTSLKDDAHGGDTNGDGGATRPRPGDWRRIYVSGRANLSHCELYYGASGNETGIIETSDSGVLEMDGCTVAHAMYDGVWNWGGTINIRNSVFFDCGNAVCPYRGMTRCSNCVMAYCNYAFMDWSHWVGGTFRNCVFYGCGNGWSDTNSSSVEFYSHSTVANCCLFNPEGYALQSAQCDGQNGCLYADPRFLDPEEGDFRIAADSPCVDAGDGAVAPARDYYGQTRQTLCADATGTPDANGSVPDIGIYEVQPRNASSDVDLAAAAVAVSEEAVVIGGKLTVSWMVENLGSAAVPSPWRDAVELIAANGTVVALGEMTTDSIAAGGRKIISAAFAVPSMEPGAARIRVKVNPYRDIYEGTQTDNNVALAETTVTVRLSDYEAPPATGLTLPSGGSVAYRVPAGSGMAAFRIRSTGAVAGYASAGAIPASLLNDAASATLSDGTVLLVLPKDADGTDYNVSFVNKDAFTVRIQVTPLDDTLAILETAPARLANTGSGHLTLIGVGMDRVAGVRLEGARTIAATEFRASSPAQLAATFDLAGVPAGNYSIGLVDEGGAALSTDATVELYKPTMGPKLEAWLDIPSNVRKGRVYSGAIRYANTGDEDMEAPLLELDFSGASVRLQGEDDWQTEELYVMGVSGQDPAGILAPGEEGQIVFEFIPGASPSFSLEYEDFSKDFADWAEKRAVLSEAATRVNRRGRIVARWGTLDQYAKFFAAGTNAQAVCGFFLNERDGAPLAGARIVALAEDGTAFSYDVVDASGMFVLEGIQGPTNVTLIVESGAETSSMHVSVPEEGDVLDVVWTGVRGCDVDVQFLGLEDGDEAIMGFVELVHSGSGAYSSGMVSNGCGTITVYRSGKFETTARIGNDKEITKTLVIGDDEMAVSLTFDFSEGGSASGVVTDEAGNPVAGAVVTIQSDDDPSYSRIVETDENGRWTASCLPAGNYAALASGLARGASIPVVMQVSDGGRTSVDGIFVVTYDNSLTVTASNALEGGYAVLTMRTGESTDVVPIGEDGTFRFDGIPEGVGDIRILNADGELVFVDSGVLVKPGENIRHVAVDAEKIIFIGTATDENGQPIQATWMLLTAQSDGLRTVSDETGTLAVELRKGDYWGTVMASGFMQESFHIRLNGHKSLSIVMKRGGFVTHVLEKGIDPSNAAATFSNGESTISASRDGTGAWIAGPFADGTEVKGIVVHSKGAYYLHSTTIHAGETLPASRMVSAMRPLRIRCGGDVAAIQFTHCDDSSFVTTFPVSDGKLSLDSYPCSALTFKAFSKAGSVVAKGEIGADQTDVNITSDNCVAISGIVTGGKPGQCAGGVLYFTDGAGACLSVVALSANGAFRATDVPNRFIRIWVHLVDGTIFPVERTDAEMTSWRIQIPNDLGVANFEVSNEENIPLNGFPVVVTFDDGFQTVVRTDDGGVATVKGKKDEGIVFNPPVRPDPPTVDPPAPPEPPTKPQEPPTCSTCGNYPCTCLVESPCARCGQNPCVCQTHKQSLDTENKAAKEVVVDPDALPPLYGGSSQVIHYSDWSAWNPFTGWHGPLWDHLYDLRYDIRGTWMLDIPHCPDSSCTYCDAKNAKYNNGIYNRFVNLKTNLLAFEEQLRDELRDMRHDSGIRRVQQAVAVAGIVAVPAIGLAAGAAVGGGVAAVGASFIASTTASVGFTGANMAFDAMAGEYPGAGYYAGGVIIGTSIRASAGLMNVAGNAAAGSVLTYGVGIPLSIGQTYLRFRTFEERMNARIRNMDIQIANLRTQYYALISASKTTYRVCPPGMNCTFYGKYCNCNEETKPSTRARDYWLSVPHSCDPNEMSGPLGVGETRVVMPGEQLTYTIYFENKADATAGAQEVFVAEALSPALDWSTFEMGEIAFGNQIDTGLAGKKKGTSEAVMEGTSFLVRTQLSLDETTGQAVWHLRIVDPTTTLGWPDDPFAGFLPPNDETHRGEGHLTFRVNVREDAAPGTVIHASATIVFDTNEPIVTDPAWWNTVGGDPVVVTFDARGNARPGAAAENAPASGVYYALPAEPPALEGYEFLGWALADGTILESLSQLPEGTERVTLHALWSPRHTIAFDANGGAGEMAPVAAAGGEATALPPCGFSYDGHAFVGWATLPYGEVRYLDGSSVSGLTTIPGATVTLYAIWAKENETFFVQDGDNLQIVIDAAHDGGNILVFPGTYSPIVLTDKAIEIRAVPGADGERVVIDGGGETRCATLGRDVVLSGFVLRNGRADFGGGAYGGILVDCDIESCCAFADIKGSGGLGGGAYGSTLSRCTVTACYADDDGGGLYEGSAESSVVEGCEAGDFGGGAYNATLSGCTIYGCFAEKGGGVAGCTVRNSIVWENRLYATDKKGVPLLGNCANVTEGKKVLYKNTCTYTDSSPKPAGTGNLAKDPLFVAAAYGDFRLQSVSPVKDKGKAALAAGEFDMCGLPRVIGAAPDMGAHEVADGTPVPADYDGDGVCDAACFDAATATWVVMQSRDGLLVEAFGEAKATPVPADYDGDGRADFATYSATAKAPEFRILTREGVELAPVALGAKGATPIAVDMDGDGIADPGVFQGNAKKPAFTILPSSSGEALSFAFGTKGATPVVGDFDGDGRADFGCYTATASKPAFSVALSGRGWNEKQPLAVTLGAKGSAPCCGDFDGDGTTDFAAYSGTAATPQLCRMFSTSKWREVRTLPFGKKGSRAATGDWDGDGAADAAIEFQGAWWRVTRDLGVSPVPAP